MHALATWYMTTLPVVGDTFISVSKCTEGFSFQSLQEGKFPIYKAEYMIGHNTRIQVTFRPNTNKTK